ncbi:MAG: Fe-S cluster assembly ATPase SufC [Candidatus Peribacter sp.]|jgi:Fe-S cluster assembly ATP-binding protein|nr:Fe-S cluster assembly ATPase SufC [Candidatus Peribacter sp.]MBT4393122.1 Fe-S cluster assembly ATPase SufC [Candidatus Peribacter sp.]MBT4600921.1 Fe-S cluster assembly ATPase SufC [Candidatus Peribacter sp.]MBT5148949.1 Fe-S cluster assembly ATPase SufC [Candidatus Peribacter sp.]MBT5638372.1 Fe-S cluster assembly ATPase SufC [Candidatus Peribacter sp.]
MLNAHNLHISVDDKEIVKGIDLNIEEGQIHAIMGPNGSGKSTLVSTLMGHPGYTVTAGSVEFMGKDLLAQAPHERAQAGLFLAFQYPKEIAGVTLRSFLFAAYKAQMKVRNPEMKVSSPIKFKALLEGAMKSLKMDTAFAERFVNQGFSGGEKKKAEVLQMHILQPSLALMDETDSGLDVDALKIVADGVNALKERSDFSALVVTHYARILDHIHPDHVHVMVDGKIVESGGKEFAQQLEEGGYEKYLQS